MSTGVTYINIAIPLKMSIMFEQIDIFSKYLDSLFQCNTSTATPTPTSDTTCRNPAYRGYVYDKYGGINLTISLLC